MQYNEVKSRVHAILDEPSWDDRTTRVVHLLIAAIILVNTIAVILFTVRSYRIHYFSLLNLIIMICILVFFAEYILRIWSCTNTRDPLHMITDRVRYASSPYLLIDLVSILPLFVPFIIPQDIAIIRLSRLLSIFKLGRFTRHATSLRQLRWVIRRKSEIFVIMLFFLVFVILFSSTVMYIIEYPAQPDTFSSIPAALWWAVMTVTTVGYGDIIPVTPVGRMIAGMVTISGVLILALPSAIMAAGLIEERERTNRQVPSEITPESAIRLIEKLGDIHSRGFITDDEFRVLKGWIIQDEKGCEE